MTEAEADRLEFERDNKVHLVAAEVWRLSLLDKQTGGSLQAEALHLLIFDWLNWHGNQKAPRFRSQWEKHLPP